MNKSTVQFDSCVARYSLLAYPYGMWLRHNLKISLRRNSLRSFSRALRAARLALELLATIYKGIL